MASILLVEADPEVAELAAHAMRPADVRIAADYESACTILRGDALGGVVFDVALPGRDPTSLVPLVRVHHPDALILAYARQWQPAALARVTELGVLMATRGNAAQLRQLARSCGAGPASGVYPRLSESAPATLVAEFDLSPRQGELAGLLLRDLPHEECAERLGVSVSTYKHHRRALLRKLGGGRLATELAKIRRRLAD